jgi:hypothetical protein
VGSSCKPSFRSGVMFGASPGPSFRGYAHAKRQLASAPVGERGWGCWARRRDLSGRHSSCWGSPTRLRPSSEGGRRLIPMARVPRLWRGEPARRRRGSAPYRLAGTVSKTCANGPASTRDLNEVFAVVCCTQPRRDCAAAAAANRREAAQNVREMFAGAGYKDCSVQHYISAATGKRQ